jgi:hypothetical protein
LNSTVPILSLLFGVLQCFAGYSFLRFVVFVTGFGVGAMSGAGTAQLLTQSSVVIGASGLFFGAAFVWLVRRLYLTGVFLLGALAGTASSIFVLQLFGKPPFSPVLILFALVWGVLAVVLQRWAVILATVAVGAAGCVLSVHHLRHGVLEWTHLSSQEKLGGIVLCLLGAYRQFSSSKAP